MYRKIFGLSLVWLKIELYLKALLFLFLSLIFFYFTFNSQPFLFKKLNLFEYRSNLSIIIISFSSLIFMLEFNEAIKYACFLLMIITNSVFMLLTLIEMIKHFFFHYLLSYFPEINKRINSYLKAKQNGKVFSIQQYANKKLGEFEFKIDERKKKLERIFFNIKKKSFVF